MSLEKLSKRKNSRNLCGKTVRCYYSGEEYWSVVCLRGGLLVNLECDWFNM